MNYFTHHLGDYLRDTAHLSLVEDAIYRRLLDLYYIREAPLTADLQALSRLIRVRGEAECSAVQLILTEFFTLGEDGLWHQKRADAEIEIARAAIQRARDNGRRGGRPRKATPIPEETQPVPVGNPRKTKSVISGLAKRNPLESSPTTNHQPSVTNVTESARFDASNCPAGVNAAAWSEWVGYRAKRRRPITEHAARQQWRALSALSAQAQAECVAHSIRNDYQGLFPERFSNESNRPDRNSGADRSQTGIVRAKVERELAESRASGDRVIDMAADDQPIRPSVDEFLRHGH